MKGNNQITKLFLKAVAVAAVAAAEVAAVFPRCTREIPARSLGQGRSPRARTTITASGDRRLYPTGITHFTRKFRTQIVLYKVSVTHILASSVFMYNLNYFSFYYIVVTTSSFLNLRVIYMVYLIKILGW